MGLQEDGKINKNDLKEGQKVKKLSLKKVFVWFCIVIVSFVISNKLMPTKEVKAANAYFIKVNKSTNVVTVYNNSTKKAVKAFVCSCGSNTPVGTFYTYGRHRWRELVGKKYGQYVTRIVGPYLFHSVIYDKYGNKASLENAEFNKLGKWASHGCIRLAVRDSKWIYDNCVLKTKVVIFSGTSKNDPLGKPKMCKLSTKKKLGWDPTDPDSANPYRTITIKGDTTSVLNGVKNVTRNKEVLSKINLKQGISVIDKQGNNLTKYLKVYVKTPASTKTTQVVATSLTLSKEGTYVFTYQVTSPYSTIVKKVVLNIIVKDNGKPILSGIPQSNEAYIGDKIDVRKGVTAKSRVGVNLTSKVIIQVKRPSDAEYSILEGNILEITEQGTYCVNYSVTNPKNKMSTSCNITYDVW